MIMMDIECIHGHWSMDWSVVTVWLVSSLSKKTFTGPGVKKDFHRSRGQKKTFTCTGVLPRAETKKHLILIQSIRYATATIGWLVQSKSLFTAPARCRSDECWRTDWSSSFSNRDTDSEKLAWVQIQARGRRGGTYLMLRIRILIKKCFFNLPHC